MFYTEYFLGTQSEVHTNKILKNFQNKQNVIHQPEVTNHSEKPKFLEPVLDEILDSMQESFRMETFFF